MSEEKPHHQPFPEDEEGAPRPQPTSYTMVEPRFREIYFQFYKESYKPSVLDRKTKELIAIGISVVMNCESCMEWHIHQALLSGATQEQVLEAVDVGIEFGGGPATVAARFALKALEYHG